MRIFIFFFIIVICSLQLSAQSSIDSLKEKSYKELSESIFSQIKTNQEVAEKLSTYYIEKARKEKNQKEEFNGLDNYVQVAIWSRRFDSFDDKYQKLLDLADKNNLDKELMQSFYLQGNAYFYQGVWSKSTDLYYSAYDLAKNRDDIQFQHAILTQLGYLKAVTGNVQSALKFQKEALKLLKDTNIDDTDLSKETLESLELQSLYFIGVSYINSEKADSAKIYNARAKHLTEKIRDSCMMRYIYQQKAEINILKQKYSEALKDLNEAKSYCAPLKKGDSLVISGLYGKAFLGLKQYDKAVNILQKGSDDYKVTVTEEGFMDDHYKLLAKAYKHTGNIEKSNFYFEKYIYSIDEFNKIQDTVVTAFKQKEVDDFKKELSTIKSEKNKQQSYVIFIALGASITILILLFLLLKFYQNKKKDELKFQELLQKIKVAKADAAVKVIDTKSDSKQPITINDVSNEVTQQILEGLQKLESQRYFLKQECNAYNVAKKIKTNTSYLSKVVNSHFEKNFNTYINDLRINYAIVRLENDTRFRSFSIQSIAEELGYKSADSFTKYFKQNTGLNPSFYIKQLNQLA
ncbi:helix-turn-helix domain-containing protein [Sediminibacter sp. Hel_I_10]|uniref:helix-turn-helix domain-containing protein n=1 Tax=Sediminibacter sp. Hel_I_10 TaxID=1392490 RepID=UPI000479CDEA|nr:helix-turn-helix domain-containing protein [Sediminibacter sp. Hel_I_10]